MKVSARSTDESLGQRRGKTIFSTGLVFLLPLAICLVIFGLVKMKVLETKMALVVTVLLFIYPVVLMFFCSKRLHIYAKLVLLILVALELAAFSYRPVNRRKKDPGGFDPPDGLS